jgi:hypothetical protein
VLEPESSVSEQPSQPPSTSGDALVVALENPPFKSSYSKFRADSEWQMARGLSQVTLDRFEVFEYHNGARQSVLHGSVLLRISR